MLNALQGELIQYIFPDLGIPHSEAINKRLLRLNKRLRRFDKGRIVLCIDSVLRIAAIEHCC
jgi:hypothetical protein